jgi:hypothetical protein
VRTGDQEKIILCYRTDVSSKAAAELARTRWRRTTKAERQQVARDMNQAKMDAMTPERRSEIARKAAQARWKKKKNAAR